MKCTLDPARLVAAEAACGVALSDMVAQVEGGILNLGVIRALIAAGCMESTDALVFDMSQKVGSAPPLNLCIADTLIGLHGLPACSAAAVGALGDAMAAMSAGVR